MRQKQVYSVVSRPNIPVFGGKKPSRREGIKGMGILENAIICVLLILSKRDIGGCTINAHQIVFWRYSMCGRFTLTIEVSDIQNELNLEVLSSDWRPRFNIAPTQPVAAITNVDPGKITFLKWGLVPYWAKDPSIGSKMINARAETLMEKPSFRQAYEHRRCWILADGFFEWDRSGKFSIISGKTTPVYIKLQDEKLFGFAGLWERWKKPEGDYLDSCTIITCQPNELVGQIHNRMPVILSQGQVKGWLDSTQRGQDLAGYLKPFPAEKMLMYPVSRLVNNPDIDEPKLVLPLVE
jgi:putative SOS response-associated peptidase YedK